MHNLKATYIIFYSKTIQRSQTNNCQIIGGKPTAMAAACARRRMSRVTRAKVTHVLPHGQVHNNLYSRRLIIL